MNYITIVLDNGEARHCFATDEEVKLLNAELDNKGRSWENTVQGVLRRFFPKVKWFEVKRWSIDGAHLGAEEYSKYLAYYAEELSKDNYQILKDVFSSKNVFYAEYNSGTFGAKSPYEKLLEALEGVIKYESTNRHS